MPLTNHQFRLAARPQGLPKRSDWNYTEEPVRDPGPGEVLVKTLYLSLDPAMRGWMNEGRSYVAPVGIGEVMRAGGAGRVIASGNPAFALGDHVTGVLGAQEYALVGAEAAKGLTKVDPKLVPLPVYVGALGVTGLTA
ncbi:MAG TPA: NADP-dependent oxidoreductase, partial [Candidatus Angelobacter sp.]